jgi:uncharacterized membrane protein
MKTGMQMKRIESIDKARGLVMVIMALDHVREFLHVTAASADPLNLASTTSLLFITRWVTHLCAPAFVFISGISAYLYFNRNGDLRKARNYLLTRGIWLVFLEVTVVNFALWFDIRFRLVILEVIGTIGFGFILLSLMQRLSPRTIGITGIVLVFTHDLWARLPATTNPVLTFLATVFFRPGLTPFGEGFSFLSSYPVVPWLGIMLAGFGAGAWYAAHQENRIRKLLLAGVISIVVFLVLRMANLYGEPSSWTLQKSGLFSVLSFLNLTKYPPSLLYSLLFTGITLFMLALFEKRSSTATALLAVFGRVPLFYFVIHLYIIHLLMFGVFLLQGFVWKDFQFGAFMNGRPAEAAGLELAWIYVLWIVLIILLYPLCRWYGKIKAAEPAGKILKYL